MARRYLPSLICGLAHVSLCWAVVWTLSALAHAAEPAVGDRAAVGNAVDDRSLLSLAPLPLNVFGGRRAELDISTAALSSLAKPTVWSLQTAAKQIVAGGRVVSEQRPGRVTLTVDVPPVKAGITASWILRIAENSHAQSAVELPVVAFPAQPWEGRAAVLQQAQLTLFDPLGKTAETLTAHEVPFARQHNAAALGTAGERLILIGEGISWREQPWLLDSLCQLARERQAHVICLAPRDGSWEYAEALAQASSIAWRRHAAIRESSALLDTRWWQPDGPGKCRGWEPQGAGAAAIWTVTEAPAAWPWIDCQFADGAGSLVCCGFAVIEGWNDSPTPRYLLANMLDSAAQRTLRRSGPISPRSVGEPRR